MIRRLISPQDTLSTPLAALYLRHILPPFKCHLFPKSIDLWSSTDSGVPPASNRVY